MEVQELEESNRETKEFGSTGNAMHLLADLSLGHGQSTLAKLLENGYTADPFPSQVLDMLAKGQKRSREVSLADCVEQNGRLIYQERLYVPDFEPLRLHLLQQHHDVPAAGHPGRSKTLDLLGRTYFWPGMRKDVDRYVRNCHTCQRSRTPRHASYGILQSLPIGESPWQHLSMDFVTGLP